MLRGHSICYAENEKEETNMSRVDSIVELLGTHKVILQCLGELVGPGFHGFLNGNLASGNVGLSLSADERFPGTKWEIRELSFPTFVLKCLDPHPISSAGGLFLDGHTQDASVRLAPRTDQLFTGTHWKVKELSRGVFVFQCLGDL